jgi:hypothetical protein
MSISYTSAQLRAFAWLPEDGSWRKCDADEYVPASMSISIAFVEYRGSRFDPEYRLTPAGIAERARLVKEELIG